MIRICSPRNFRFRRTIPTFSKYNRELTGFNSGFISTSPPLVFYLFFIIITCVDNSNFDLRIILFFFFLSFFYNCWNNICWSNIYFYVFSKDNFIWTYLLVNIFNKLNIYFLINYFNAIFCCNIRPIYFNSITKFFGISFFDFYIKSTRFFDSLTQEYLRISGKWLSRF